MQHSYKDAMAPPAGGHQPTESAPGISPSHPPRLHCRASLRGCLCTGGQLCALHSRHSPVNYLFNTFCDGRCTTRCETGRECRKQRSRCVTKLHLCRSKGFALALRRSSTQLFFSDGLIKKKSKPQHLPLNTNQW